MKIIEKAIVFGGEELLLTNQNAIFWKRKNALILADLHLGKAAYFRKNGISLPTQLAQKDLDRLRALIRYYNLKCVIVVGDLIHAGNNKEVEKFLEFRREFPGIQFFLIKGNHDRCSDAYFSRLGIDAVYTQWDIEGITFMHESSFHLSPTISGHIHPAVSLNLPPKGIVRFPCYIVQPHQLILPAFSSFTGLNSSGKYSGATYFAIHPDGLFEVH